MCMCCRWAPSTPQSPPAPTHSSKQKPSTKSKSTRDSLNSPVPSTRKGKQQRRSLASEMKTEESAAAGGWGLGTGRPCDTCAADAARLYCRSDGAYLCAGCDARAHSAGSRHARVWLCEVCEHAPAAVTCRADAAALCAACDADIHSANPLAGRHERIPVAPFFGALSDAAPPLQLLDQQLAVPSAAAKTTKEEDPHADDGDDGSDEAEAASWLLPEPGDSHEDNAAADAAFFASTDAYLGLDLDFVRSMEDGIKAIGVPVAPSGIYLAAGGIYYPEHSMNHSLSSSEAAVVPDALSAGGAPSVAVVACKGKDREARLMRYREKRKNRRFHKTIRYASRKAYAETRPRIKGRFAKRTADAEDDALLEHDGPFSPASDYGVVPSF